MIRRTRLGLFATLLSVALLCAGRDANAQSAENVALVINDASAASQQIGDHYRRTRAIPDVNVIRITTTVAETIARPDYVSQVEAPIAAAIRRNQLQDRILYIVLTKGVPLRIDGTEGHDGTIASVDSELTLLYRRMTGRDATTRGRVANPYFLGAEPIANAQAFTHRVYDIFLITRLDAFTVQEAMALIDRAQTPSATGKFVLDQRAGFFATSIGDRWLEAAHERLTSTGFSDRVQLETTTSPARDVETVLGYYSWGSNDPQNRARRTGLQFAPGALAAMFVSTDARTMQEPPMEWEPANDWNNRGAWFAGSPQSLIGDLIREGITGVAGQVAEPYLQSSIRPEILFPAYASGFTLAEAFYLAMPDLSWQTVIIGDPLCTAFPRKLLTRTDIEAGTDPETEFPAHYAERRKVVARAIAKSDPAAVNLMLRAESRFDRGDQKGRREALEAATKIAPELVSAHLILGVLDEQAGDFLSAKPRYQQVLKAQPNNVLALNNLAYGLAVHDKAFTDALVLARRAATLAPNDVSILDTLGWIEHLSGNSQAAGKIFQELIKRPGATGLIRLHAAVVFAALGDVVTARTLFTEAIAQDPTLSSSADAKLLTAQLKP